MGFSVWSSILIILYRIQISQVLQKSKSQHSHIIPEIPCPAGLDRTHLRQLLQVRAEELFDFIKGNDVLPVVEVGVDCAGDKEQLLIVGIGIVPHHIGKGVLAEVAGVCFFSVNYQYRIADLIAVTQNGHIEEG